MMKKAPVLCILVFIVTVFSLSGCGHYNNQEAGTEVTTVSSSEIDYFGLNTLTFSELADSADLIAFGTVNRTVEVVPHELFKEVWLTMSAFHVEKSLKGDYSDEIIVVQTGAVGKGENPDSPILKPGEQCCLFLTKGTDGLYRLVDRQGRFRIEEGRVFSVASQGESPLAYDLQYRNADMNVFVSRVIEAIKSEYTIPYSEPVISMDLLWTMSGRRNELSIFENGTIVYVREWGLRFPMPDHPSRRAWQFGKFNAENIIDLFNFFYLIGFNDLDDAAAVEPIDGAGITSDLIMTVTAHNRNAENSVISSGYFTPDTDTVGKILPPPYDAIYIKLMKVADEKTKEAYREDIPERNDITYEYPE